MNRNDLLAARHSIVEMANDPARAEHLRKALVIAVATIDFVIEDTKPAVWYETMRLGARRLFYGLTAIKAPQSIADDIRGIFDAVLRDIDRKEAADMFGTRRAAPMPREAAPEIPTQGLKLVGGRDVQS